jgi:hypothetical protein
VCRCVAARWPLGGEPRAAAAPRPPTLHPAPSNSMRFPFHTGRCAHRTGLRFTTACRKVKSVHMCIHENFSFFINARLGTLIPLPTRKCFPECSSKRPKKRKSIPTCPKSCLPAPCPLAPSGIFTFTLTKARRRPAAAFQPPVSSSTSGCSSPAPAGCSNPAPAGVAVQHQPGVAVQHQPV